MAEPMLRCRDVRVGPSTRPRVGPLSLDVSRGQFVALVGPNGSGKTSLLAAIAGLACDSGIVEVGGAALYALPSLARARRLAYVPQQSALSAPLTVETVVAMGLCVRGATASECEQAVGAALARVDALHLARRRFSELSLGEQRRALLARAIATSAPLLLLDEPDAYLDVGQRARLFATLRSLASEGTTLVVVVHALAEAMAEAERVVVLSAGRIVADGDPGTALSPSILREVFGVERREREAPRFVLGEGES